MKLLDSIVTGFRQIYRQDTQHLHTGAITAIGKTIGQNIADAQNYNTEVIKPLGASFKDKAGIAVLLHTAPEAAAGGPLAIAQNGDLIEFNVPQRQLHLLHINDEELARRLAGWKAPPPPLSSGYWKLYVDPVLQADEGVDLDFLVGKRGSFVLRDNH